MNILTSKVRLPMALSLLVLAGGAAVAQAPSGGSPTSIITAFVKLFGTAGAFTAKAEARVLDPSPFETGQAPAPRLWISPCSTAKFAWRSIWP